MTEPSDPVTRSARRRARRAARVRSFDYGAVLAYDGRRFAGFARQPDCDTVEAALRQALEPFAPGLRRLAVAGRTDRGVSATAQVISFRCDAPLAPGRIEAAIDDVRPGALSCRSAFLAPRGFHARYQATERRYAYLHPEDNAPSVERLDAMLQRLVGERDFAALGRDLPQGRSTVRRLSSASCRGGHLEGRPVVVFELAADGFLRKMARTVVATALHRAERSEDPDALVHALSDPDQPRLRPAPPEPLRLIGVRYPDWSAFG